MSGVWDFDDRSSNFTGQLRRLTAEVRPLVMATADRRLTDEELASLGDHDRDGEARYVLFAEKCDELAEALKAAKNDRERERLSIAFGMRLALYADSASTWGVRK